MLRFYLCSLLCFVVISCGRGDIYELVIKGSDTEVAVVLSLAESFMERDERAAIAVTGGGSGSGIAALVNGKTTLANSSRPMNDEEIKLARARGIDPQFIIFAVDALAIIVHATQQVDTLSLQQVANIFSGKIKNWAEVGGKNQQISLYGRQNNSGTYLYFRDAVIKSEYDNQMRQMNGTAQVIEAVKTDQAAISYAGIGHLTDTSGKPRNEVKIVWLKKDDSTRAQNPVDHEAIMLRRYPIVRPLYQYINGKPTSHLRSFIEYELSADGQATVKKNGYFPVDPEAQKHNDSLLSN